MTDNRQKAHNSEGPGNSELFTVRLWMEELGAEGVDYRGQVKHVTSGATRNFRHWSDLQAFLVGTLDDYKGGVRGKTYGR